MWPLLMEVGVRKGQNCSSRWFVNGEGSLAHGSSMVRVVSHEASQGDHLAHSGLMELANSVSQGGDVKPSKGVLRNGGLGEEVLTRGWDSLRRKVTFETYKE